MSTSSTSSTASTAEPTLLDTLELKKDSVYLILNLHRLGCLEFIVHLEYERYTPGTENNDKYNAFYIQYNSIPHCILEIPSGDFSATEDLGRAYNLVCKPGVPYCSDAEEFRLKSYNCFTVQTERYQEMTEDMYRQALKEERDRVVQYIEREFQSTD